MTLAPTKLGDRGQRFVVQAIGYPDANVPDWQDVAFAYDKGAAQQMLNSLLHVPTIRHIRIWDRQKEPNQ